MTKWSDHIIWFYCWIFYAVFNINLTGNIQHTLNSIVCFIFVFLFLSTIKKKKRKESTDKPLTAMNIVPTIIYWKRKELKVTVLSPKINSNEEDQTKKENYFRIFSKRIRNTEKKHSKKLRTKNKENKNGDINAIQLLISAPLWIDW